MNARPTFQIVPANPSQEAMRRAASHFPELFLVAPVDYQLPNLHDRLRDDGQRKREQRKAAFVSALVVASNAIVIGAFIGVAVLSSVYGWSW